MRSQTSASVRPWAVRDVTICSRCTTRDASGATREVDANTLNVP